MTTARQVSEKVYRVGVVPIDNPEQAIGVLSALGFLPAVLGPPRPASTPDTHTPRYGSPAPDPVPVEADSYDSPASFTDAGRAFADLVDGYVSAHQAARALSHLAQQGLIVSAAYHDEVVSGAGLVEDLSLMLGVDPR